MNGSTKYSSADMKHKAAMYGLDLNASTGREKVKYPD